MNKMDLDLRGLETKPETNHYQDTYMTFVDFSKVFDYFVQREFLLHKLLNLCITCKLNTSIKSVYTNPESCVDLNGYHGEWFVVGSGGRQGDLLSLILFTSFIIDLGI